MKDLIKIFKEHIDYRQQLVKLAKADIVKTYRGAALGWAWAVIKPAVTIFVYWFAVEIGLRVGKQVNGYPFFLWLIAGLIPWFYMNDMLTSGTESIRKNRHLVTKMKFPVATIPTFVSMSKLAINLILITLMIIIFWILGYAPDIYYLQILFFIGLSFAFWTVWAFFSSMIAAISKDFANLIKSFVTAIFWLSGIIWDPEQITVGWVKAISKWNPVTYIASGFRDSFINKVWFWQKPETLIYFLIVFAILAILAMFTYKKLRKEIPDVL